MALLLLLPETPFLGTNNNPPEKTNFEVGNRREEMGFRDLSVQDRQGKSSMFEKQKKLAQNDVVLKPGYKKKN
ncbi:hypothetical protein ACE6H2_004759 [Prunus campanulata]